MENKTTALVGTEKKSLRAFIVEDRGYESEVVFAHSKKKALRLSQYPDVRRASEFDAYVPMGFVPPAALFAAGWYLTCHNDKCSNRVEQDGERYDAETDSYEDMEAVFVGQAAYCSPACNDAANADHVRRRALAVELRAGLLAKWPDVTPGECATYNQPPMIYFRFPGSQHDATWELGADHIKIAALDSARYDAYKTLILPIAKAEKAGGAPTKEGRASHAG